jgi:hypothetical protein
VRKDDSRIPCAAPRGKERRGKGTAYFFREKAGGT